METQRPRAWRVSALLQIAVLAAIYLIAPQIMEGSVPWVEAAFFYFFTGIAFWDIIPGEPIAELLVHISLFVTAIVLYVRAGCGHNRLRHLVAFNSFALAWTLFPLFAILAGDYRGP